MSSKQNGPVRFRVGVYFLFCLELKMLLDITRVFPIPFGETNVVGIEVKPSRMDRRQIMTADEIYISLFGVNETIDAVPIKALALRNYDHIYFQIPLKWLGYRHYNRGQVLVAFQRPMNQSSAVHVVDSPIMFYQYYAITALLAIIVIIILYYKGV